MVSEFTFLSGGTGTPKLLQGFRALVGDEKIDVICNTGDDYYWNSLLVSPDLDTVLYLFADKLDTEKFWGRRDESFHVLDELRTFVDEPYLNTWFLIGDKDLALHVYRNHLMRRGDSLTDVTKLLLRHWNIDATILPMSNEKVSSIIHTDSGEMHFQEFFVKHRTDVDVQRVEFRGAEEAHITPQGYKSLNASKHIIIGPSNPVTSIGPFLAVDEIRDTVSNNHEKVVVVSPIRGNSAFSGPTIKLMRAQGMKPDVLGLAEHYAGLASKMVLDVSDSHLKGEVEDLGLEVLFTDISMGDQSEKEALASYLLEVL